MYNLEATRLMIVIFLCMLAAIAGGMIMLPGNNDEDADSAISGAMGMRLNHSNAHARADAESVLSGTR